MRISLYIHLSPAGSPPPDRERLTCSHFSCLHYEPRLLAVATLLAAPGELRVGCWKGVQSAPPPPPSLYECSSSPAFAAATARASKALRIRQSLPTPSAPGYWRCPYYHIALIMKLTTIALQIQELTYVCAVVLNLSITGQ